MKKLIPAIVLLLISAIVMSTASYAWFSMNATVTATGMQVQAVTDGALYISKAEVKPDFDDITLSTVTLPTTTTVNNETVIPALKPTSTVNVADWYTVGAEAANSYEKNASNFAKVEAANEGDYFIKKVVWIRSEKDFDKLYVKGVKVTSNYDDDATDEVLGQSITVAFNVVNYTPTAGAVVTTSSDAPKFVANEALSRRHGAVKENLVTDDWDNDDDTPDTELDIGQIDTTNFAFVTTDGLSASTSAIWTKPAQGTVDVTNAVFQVEIYLYFDGQSSSCYSNALTNAITFDATVDVEFATA